MLPQFRWARSHFCAHAIDKDEAHGNLRLLSPADRKRPKRAARGDVFIFEDFRGLQHGSRRQTPSLRFPRHVEFVLVGEETLHHRVDLRLPHEARYELLELRVAEFGGIPHPRE